jgi:hypothetical protein
LSKQAQALMTMFHLQINLHQTFLSRINIALVMGSTFVNGALDGISALTANTTPIFARSVSHRT